MLNISVMASGGGTNFQAILDALASGEIENAEVKLLIASNDKAFAIERAKGAGIKTVVISAKDYPDMDAKTDAILKALAEAETDLIVLAGYMSILDPRVIQEYSGRIINIHPSLIPKHCGKGMYGLKVHEAVLAAGDTETGATVHYVDEGVDTGEIILQEKVPVMDGDTPEVLQKRVLETEHKILPAVIQMIAAGTLGVE
ncbi:MAG: phosphoribosylglycinamide formyltransferase [Bacillota bacterium]|nr:phosphoribosylglycinamide formyltransferase [Bacillota bacterium]